MEPPLPHSAIVGLPVETKSGKKLGKVSRIEIHPEQHIVLRYAVKPSNLLKELVTDELLIAPTQVIVLTAEKMVVEDLALEQKEAARAGAAAPSV